MQFHWITFVLKSKYDADVSELENKIPGTSGLVKELNMILKLVIRK